MSAWAAAREAAGRLREAGIDEAGFEAEYLARVASGLDRARYFAGGELDRHAERRFAAAIDRRLAREPAAYIVGEREFGGHLFRVTRDVLVPRPETELLVEAGIAAVRDLATIPHPLGRDSACPIAMGEGEIGASLPEAPIVVDVGTGSGCVAVAVALGVPRARVIALDVSPRALALAAANAGRLAARVVFARSDLLAGIGRADVVLANLPYIPTMDIAGLEPEVRDWEPRVALDGGADGLTLIRRLVADCGTRVRPRLLALEVGLGQAGRVAALAAGQGADVTVERDLAGIERMVCARWR